MQVDIDFYEAPLCVHGRWEEADFRTGSPESFEIEAVYPAGSSINVVGLFTKVGIAEILALTFTELDRQKSMGRQP